QSPRRIAHRFPRVINRQRWHMMLPIMVGKRALRDSKEPALERAARFIARQTRPRALEYFRGYIFGILPIAQSRAQIAIDRTHMGAIICDKAFGVAVRGVRLGGAERRSLCLPSLQCRAR